MTLYIFLQLQFCYIFLGLYFRILSLSFYYTHYCNILFYRIIYYIVNRQFSLVAATFLRINYLSICLQLTVTIATERISNYISLTNYWRPKQLNCRHVLLPPWQELVSFLGQFLQYTRGKHARLLSFSPLLRTLVHILEISPFALKDDACYPGSTCLGLLFTGVLSALPVDHQIKATWLNMSRIT